MAKRKRKTAPKRKWMVVVMAEYRKNKKGGLKGAMKRAKKRYRK